jgi:Mannosyltransferase (PIG-V)
VSGEAEPAHGQSGILSGLATRLRPVRYPVAMGLSTTVITFALGICGALIFEKPLPPESWLGLWQQWDAPSFLDIAQHGYPGGPGEREHLVAQLPFYPLTIWITHLLIPNWHAAAVVVSNICTTAALAYFFLLVQMDFDVAIARRAVLFCAIFPTAYFLHIAYSEGVFLLLTVAAVFYARRSQWLVAAVLASFATATRLPGAAVLPALVVEYLHQRNFRWRAIRADAAFLALIPLGAAAYLWINYRGFGDPFHFFAVQKELSAASVGWPLPSVLDNWDGIRHASADKRLMLYGGPLVAFIFTTIMLAVAPFVLRPSYFVYSLFSWIVIFFNNFPISSPRFVLMVFPVFILIARASCYRWLCDSIAFLFAIFYALCAIHFVKGDWTF